MQNLIINEELRTLLPPLSDEEYAGLEQSILKDGILTPLIVWNDILIDGHHRYEICTRHQIPFSVTNVVLEGLDDAKLWVWKHQTSRRNLSDFHRGELALKLKDAIAAKAKERQRCGQGGVLLPSTLTEAKETRQELAQIAGVSSGNLTKVEYISEHADDETKEKLRKGEKGTSINKEYNRIKRERGDQKPKPAKKRETEIAPIWKGVKINQSYCCGNLFEPDPDDDYFDWITDEEREELRKMQATCPNRLVPPIRNYTIQNIPEHKPDQMLACLFSLFKVTYRKKLFMGLARKMFRQDGDELTRELVNELYNEFN